MFVGQGTAKLTSLFQSIVDNKISAEDLNANQELRKIDVELTEAKNKLKQLGPTSQLWIQYIKMMDIFKTNVRANRTADFQLHLQTVQAMLPFYPAAGHNNYTKSIKIYLQDMQALSVSNPGVLAFSDDGNFVTRRTNRFWGGLPDDLIIEQVNFSYPTTWATSYMYQQYLKK